jgi:hypothetical protein
MLPYLAAMVVGGILVQRRRPSVSHVKKTALGPRSGITYLVDDFASAGLVLVKAPDGSVASFARQTPPQKGFEFVRGTGNPRVIDLIKKDFLP